MSTASQRRKRDREKRRNGGERRAVLSIRDFLVGFLGFLVLGFGLGFLVFLWLVLGLVLVLRVVKMLRCLARW